MTTETLKDALKNFGVTEKEAEVYIFLAKRWALKTGQISKQMKKNKGQIYRLLVSLQEKGLVETTLEFPTRFVAVPLEKILDSFIQSKREEVALVEKTKTDLLEDWKNINKTALSTPLEKFAVIEGGKKIFHKMSQMIKDTKSQLSAILTVPDLARAEQYDVFESIYLHPLRNNAKFLFLTELSNQNLEAMQLLRKKLKSGLNLRGRNPDLGSTGFPRLVIKDNEEIIFYITKNDQEMCLCTNCESLIQAFSNVFDNLWINSSAIKQKILELKTGKSPLKMVLIRDSIKAKRKYYELLENAQHEIIIVTSSEGLIELNNRLTQLKDWSEKGLSIRVMAPIIEKNLKVSQNLLKFCKVKHVPISYLETTIIDKKHLFQFKQPPSGAENQKSLSFFKNIFYTNNEKYIKKTVIMLNNIWEKACIPSTTTIESIIIPTETGKDQDDSPLSAMKNFRKVLVFSIEDETVPGNLTEKDVLNKILTAKTSEPIFSKDAELLFASTGQAIIHPPKYFHLPDLMFHAWHVDEHSSRGGDESLVVFLWKETSFDSGFVPVAIISNNPNKIKPLKKIFGGTPADQNVQLLKKDEFHVRIHGNTLFAGWTKPLKLQPPKYFLPPCYLQIEGFGKVKTGKLSIAYRNGYKNKMEFNALEALITFFHPSSQYTGPGTDGILFRDYVGEVYMPK